ncbi:hypothetical protein MRS44_017185 [Fusarium solani]|uniref:Pectin lyase fold/virulence factor n=1 Tax=Fusarium solani TaxID=169388 RepID=A0A9P9GTE8_FUSSL|nr:pectin lyase fold/virulence factor [Fusarium solani]KAH7243832.1 pectin lyase fold/virulence factor [Fusarium solani]KAJ3455703.1 hypothetical protein MRS44_017185 [Fusarium solani]
MAGANTFECGPESGPAAPPTFRKQVTADMPLYNVGDLAKVMDSPSTPRLYASKLFESVSVKDFGAKGDGVADDTEAIQAAIDFALQNAITEVYVPDGRYLTSDTLHLGWGNSFYTINLVGPRTGTYWGNNPDRSGARILPTKTDRPCINIQGGRNSGIHGIGFLSEKLAMYIETNIAGASQNFPSDPAGWNDNRNIPRGLQRNAPFCCISIDAYTAKERSYPAVKYPPWTGLGQDTQTQLAPSSRCTIDSCDISGFCVGVITEPCGGDGNGDFTRIRNCNIGTGVYGIAICHTQSRSVEIRNCVWTKLHTFLDNSTFGQGLGQLDGGMDLCSGGTSYQAFNIGTTTWVGGFVVKNLYMESTVRLGLFSGGFATFQAAVLFEGCRFAFHPETWNGVPADAPVFHLEVNGTAAVKFSHCRFDSGRFFVTNASAGVVFENCQWTCGGDYAANSHGAFLDPAIALGYDHFGGLHIINRTNTRGPQIIGQCEATHFRWDPQNNKLFSAGQYFQSASNVSVRDPNMEGALVHAAAESYRDAQGRNWPILLKPSSTALPLGNNGTFTVQPSQSGMTLSGEISALAQAGKNVGGFWRRLDPGDILEDSSTCNVYIVTSVKLNATTNNFVFTAEQQNNYSVRTGTAVPSKTVSSGPSLYLYKAIRLPRDMYFGDFAANSTNVTNVHRGNGYGDRLKDDIPIGMLIAEEPSVSVSGDYAVASKGNVRIASVANGSPGTPGSLMLTSPASYTGRFPIMPVMLAGVNVRTAGLQPKHVGRFKCAIATSTTVPEPNITAQSRILLIPANSEAAALMGSAKSLYVSAKSPGASFTVVTADGTSANGNETFDYLIDA